MNRVVERLAALREAMKKSHVSAYIIPSTDPHASEYVADYWKEREFISGFTGSAGTVVVTLHKAALWTDSRYFLQAERQLDATGIALFKEGLPETPSYAEWLRAELSEGESVGLHAAYFSVAAYAQLEQELASKSIRLESVELIDAIWTDRPSQPISPFFLFDEQYAGKSMNQKLDEVRTVMQQHQADLYIVSTLDEIAWLLNIRGTDIDYNPLVISYLIVEQKKCTLFVGEGKLTPQTIQFLLANNVYLSDYDTIYAAIRLIENRKSVLFDPQKLNRALFSAIQPMCRKIAVPSPIFRLKSIKNEVELSGFRKAVVADGAALVRFYRWLEQTMQEAPVTEYEVMLQLKQFRAANSHFMGESFGSIVGFGPNGAIVHYTAHEDSCVTLTPNNLLLVDSGGQYYDGTTDITRTTTLGHVTPQQQHDYTLVLKGHVALSKAKFPKGTRGAQLDVLARQPMWNEGINYGHGTGHGVGHFLCVHEGPQSIRMQENPVPLEVGMVLSNEPGIYRAGEYGIRIENLLAVTPAFTTPFGEYLQFETLTLYPYDQNLIQVSMLDPHEIEWINQYHQRVLAQLSPLLTREEQAWLAHQCRKI